MIKITNLQKSFDKDKSKYFALNVPSLTFESNKKYAIIGANGSGKSTLLKCIAKVIDYQGEIEIDGKIAYMPQDTVIFKMTTLKNLEIVNKEKANEALSEFYLSEYSKKRGDKLSGGEKQRLALARTFIAQSDILLLDEPTSMIDVSFTNKIESKIKNLDKCVIFATHSFRQAKNLADEIIYFEKGEVVEILKKCENFEVKTSKLQNFLNEVI